MQQQEQVFICGKRGEGLVDFFKKNGDLLPLIRPFDIFLSDGRTKGLQFSPEIHKEVKEIFNRHAKKMVIVTKEENKQKIYLDIEEYRKYAEELKNYVACIVGDEKSLDAYGRPTKLKQEIKDAIIGFLKAKNETSFNCDDDKVLLNYYVTTMLASKIIQDVITDGITNNNMGEGVVVGLEHKIAGQMNTGALDRLIFSTSSKTGVHNHYKPLFQEDIEQIQDLISYMFPAVLSAIVEEKEERTFILRNVNSQDVKDCIETFKKEGLNITPDVVEDIKMLKEAHINITPDVVEGIKMLKKAGVKITPATTNKMIELKNQGKNVEINKTYFDSYAKRHPGLTGIGISALAVTGIAGFIVGAIFAPVTFGLSFAVALTPFLALAAIEGGVIAKDKYDHGRTILPIKEAATQQHLVPVLVPAVLANTTPAPAGSTSDTTPAPAASISTPTQPPAPAELNPGKTLISNS
jgi:hypothetical protein